DEMNLVYDGVRSVEVPIVDKKQEIAMKHILRLMYGSGKYDNIQLEVMVGSHSNPLRIDAYKNNKKIKSPLYVKRPDGMRLLGKYLYSFFAPDDASSDFLFHWGIFVEKESKGLSAESINEDMLIHAQEYRRGIIKSAL